MIIRKIEETIGRIHDIVDSGLNAEIGAFIILKNNIKKCNDVLIGVKDNNVNYNSLRIRRQHVSFTWIRRVAQLVRAPP